MFSSISRLWSSDGSSGQYATPDPLNDLPVFQAHDLEKEADKRTRSLRHLVKLNHATFSLLHEESHCINTVPDNLAAAYDLDCSAQDLDEYYDYATQRGLTKWQGSPTEVSKLDWTDFLGQTQYQRAFLDFFEDEVVEMGYHWRQLATRYLFHGDRPLAEAFGSKNGQPLTRLSYGLMLSSREMVMEGLALLATCWSKDTSVLQIDRAVSSMRPTFDDPLEILLHIAKARRSGEGERPLEHVFEDFQNSWTVSSIALAVKQAQITAAMLARNSAKVNDDFAALVTFAHGLRIVLPGAPVRHAKAALFAWWRNTLTAYVTAGCPSMMPDRGSNAQSEDSRNWTALKRETIEKSLGTESMYLPVVRSLYSASKTWPEQVVFIEAARKILSPR